MCLCVSGGRSGSKRHAALQNTSDGCVEMKRWRATGNSPGRSGLCRVGSRSGALSRHIMNLQRKAGGDRLHSLYPKDVYLVS